MGIGVRGGRSVVNERLKAGHDGRSKGGSTGRGPSARIAGAGGAAVPGIGPAKNVEVAPQTIRGKERNVGRIAHAVGRISKQRLPGRLWPTLAGSADNAGCGRRSDCTSTRSASSGDG